MFWKSWLTTVIGLGFGVLNLYANGFNIKQAAVSAAGAALGAAAKAFNVTGGK